MSFFKNIDNLIDEMSDSNQTVGRICSKMQQDIDNYFTKMNNIYSQFPLTFINNIPARIIPIGTLFYRGQVHYRDKIPDRKTAWFALDPITPKHYINPDGFAGRVNRLCKDYLYGEISVFITKKEFKILDITKDSFIQINKILSQDKNSLEAFNESWRILNDTIQRYSDLSSDIKWLTWMCENGYDGYISDSVTSFSGETFHGEIALCNWNEFLDYYFTFDSTDIYNKSFCQFTNPGLFIIFTDHDREQERDLERKDLERKAAPIETPVVYRRK